MNYWHIQMSKPQGRKGVIYVDPKSMLTLKNPVIGTGEWNDYQCRYFKNDLNENSIVCVKDGSEAVALCRVISSSFKDNILQKQFHNEHYRYVEVLEFYNGSESFPQPQGTLNKALNKKTATYKFIEGWYNSYLKNKQMNKIIDILKYKNQIILQGPPGTGKTFTAKDIAEQILIGEVSGDKKKQAERLQGSDQFELVQFHPSYTYEDFVRGIVVKSNNGQIEYKTENKIFGKIIKKALENQVNSIKSKELYSKEDFIKKLLIEYGNKLNDNYFDVQSEGTDSVIFEDDKFYYQLNSQKRGIKLNNLIKAIINNVNKAEDLKGLILDKGPATYHSSYFLKFLQKFKTDEKDKLEQLDTYKAVVPDLKKYILVIDEINRANLPSVLGELIYALEYRNQIVKSIYALEDDDKEIQIPENLYIIGTMNTADRSVGHIDYAIRRRFAFVELLPKELTALGDQFKLETFKTVSSLFVKEIKTDGIDLEASEHLSPEFAERPQDVWLGHSYFIVQKDEDGNEIDFNLRLEYEIIPILEEYMKDGILRNSVEVKDIIKGLKRDF